MTATTIDSDGYSIIIDGKRIKSHNHFAIKNDDISEIGKLKSQYHNLSIVDNVISILSKNLHARIITTDDDYQKIKGVQFTKLEF